MAPQEYWNGAGEDKVLVQGPENKPGKPLKTTLGIFPFFRPPSHASSGPGLFTQFSYQCICCEPLFSGAAKKGERGRAFSTLCAKFISLRWYTSLPAKLIVGACCSLGGLSFFHSAFRWKIIISCLRYFENMFIALFRATWYFVKGHPGNRERSISN